MDDKGQKKPVRNALGRGLSALISAVPVPVVPHRMNYDNLAQDLKEPISDSMQEATSSSQISKSSENVPEGQVQYVKISSVENNPNQPRQDFSEQELSELTESIRTLGILQPVLVRPIPSKPGYFQVVAGERRWRAATRVGLEQLPVIVRDIDDKQTLEIALVENVQRSELNPLEEAQAYERLMNEFSLSQKEVAERVGKDRASVANISRLLKLPKEVQEFLRQGKISVGHAKAILTVKEPNAQLSLAKKAIAEDLSVRALESVVGRVVVLDGNHANSKKGLTAGKRAENSTTNFPEVIDRMRNVLGTKVNIKHSPSGKGKVEIEYFSEQELDRVVEQICKS